MERGVLNLVNYGDVSKYRHIIISLTNTGEANLARQVVSENCQVIELNKQPGNDLRLPILIARTIRQNKIDILHARGWPTLVESVLGGIAQKGLVSIFGFHGKTVEDLQQGVAWKRLIAERVFIRCYQQVVTLNETMQKDFSEECQLPVDKIRVIPNGVDVKKFTPLGEQKTLRKRLGIPVDGVVVGSVGRLDPVKNHEVVFRAIQMLRSRGVDIRFLLVGDGRRHEFLQQEIYRLGIEDNVLLYGRSDSVAELINCMDLYIQSSWYEGFSNTILEAMACGVPVLISRVGGNPDIIPDFLQKYLFDPGNERELVEIILRIINTPEEKESAGKIGRAHVIQKYSIEKMVDQYQQLYQSFR